MRYKQPQLKESNNNDNKIVLLINLQKILGKSCETISLVYRRCSISLQDKNDHSLRFLVLPSYKVLWKLYKCWSKLYIKKLTQL